MKTKSKFLKVLVIIVAIPFFVAAFGYGTMMLWNWLVPALFHGPVITFWQTIGLIVLSKILFGGFKGKGGRCGGRRHMREHWRKKMEERMATMTDEEKETFRNRFMHKC